MSTLSIKEIIAVNALTLTALIKVICDCVLSELEVFVLCHFIMLKIKVLEVKQHIRNNMTELYMLHVFSPFGLSLKL